MAEMTLARVSDLWLVRPKPRPGARRRLFCIPYAGSGAAAYRGWAEGLEDLEVLYVQLPGRENRLRETPFTDFSSLITALADAVEGRLDLPYALYGHSLGGLIAFELARLLQDRLHPGPTHLFVSATRAPQLRPQYPSMRHLPDLELLQEVQRRYEAVPRQVMEDAELRELLVPCLRADLTLLETYRHSESEPLRCPITCFGATADKMVSREALAQWQAHSAHGFDLQMFEGNHLFLQNARAQLIAAILAKLATNPVAVNGPAIRAAGGGLK